MFYAQGKGEHRGLGDKWKHLGIASVELAGVFYCTKTDREIACVFRKSVKIPVFLGIDRLFHIKNFVQIDRLGGIVGIDFHQICHRVPPTLYDPRFVANLRTHPTFHLLHSK